MGEENGSNPYEYSAVDQSATGYRFKLPFATPIVGEAKNEDVLL